MIVYDIILFVIGLIGSSYSFSNGFITIGLLFIMIMIIGFLMNPPKRQQETE